MSIAPADQTPTPHLVNEPAAPLVILIEEKVVVIRELVETGRVRLPKTVTEQPKTLPLNLRHEQVEVRRIPATAFLTLAAPAG